MTALPIVFPDQEPRTALIARIKARRKRMEVMAGSESSHDLDELADAEEEDLKALARMPVNSFEHLRQKVVLLADRELEERITFGEMALIMSILSDLTHPLPPLR